jgi:hypothetical protein
MLSRQSIPVSRATKNLQTPAKWRMKAFTISAEKQFRRTGLILLFVGEADIPEDLIQT